MKIHVKNFQIIQNCELDFSGLVCVQGTNDTGKSALIRAVKGLVETKSGDDFINYDADQCKVVFDDGEDRVEWVKPRGSGSEYKINGTKYDKIGRGRFEELDKYGLFPVDTGRDEFYLNFVDQFDSLLLFGRPDTRKFEIISSSLIDYQKFENSIDQIKDDQKEVKESITRLEGELNSLDESIEQTECEIDLYEQAFEQVPSSFVEKLEEQIQEGEDIADITRDIKSKQERLESISVPDRAVLDSVEKGIHDISVERVSRLNDLIDQKKEVQSRIEEIDELLDQWDQVDNVEDLDVGLIGGLNDYIELTKKISRIEEVLDLYEELDVGLQDDYEEMINLFEIVQEFDTIRDGIMEAMSDISGYEDVLDDLKEQKQELEGKLEVCPVCESEFS